MIRRFIKWSIITGLAISSLAFLYLRFGGYFFINPEIKCKLVESIKASPNLPNRFHELFDIAYPKSLERDYLSLALDNKLLGSKRSESPSFLASYLGSYFWGTKIYMLTFYVEDHTTQKECLNYIAQHSDFINKNRGVKQASLFYFKKELENLNDEEMMTLIIMINNPSYYNPIRKKELTRKRVKELLEQSKDNEVLK